MGGHSAVTHEGESSYTNQNNIQNNSQSYNNEFGNNAVHTGNIGNGGTAYLQNLGNVNGNDIYLLNLAQQ